MSARNLMAGKNFIRESISGLSPRRLTYRLFCLDSRDAGIRRWRVHRRILREKACRHKAEPSWMNRHNRPILSAWDVRHAQGVPDDYVSVFNRAVGACPFRQSLPAEVEIDVLAGGEHFLRAVCRHPQMRIDESGLTPRR